MEHYSDHVLFHSSTVIRRWKEPTGKLAGKEAVERHFRRGMEEVRGMQMEFECVLFGYDSLVLIYKRETGIRYADVVRFDDNGKVVEVSVHYGENGD